MSFVLKVEMKTIKKTGEYIAARIPYGYKKEILGGYTKYRIDGEKAAVVKTIFGKSKD